MDWREDFRGFEDDPQGPQKAICGLIWMAPVFVLIYVIVAILAAL